jgi:hypothetical protein
LGVNFKVLSIFPEISGNIEANVLLATKRYKRFWLRQKFRTKMIRVSNFSSQVSD